MLSYKNHNKQAFTLVELLTVLVVLAILGAIIVVTINPTKRLFDTRSAQRESEANSLEDAIGVYVTDNLGEQLSQIEALTPNLYYQIGTASSGCAISCDGVTAQSACVDLRSLEPNYVQNLPLDPLTGTTAQTGFYVKKSTLNAIEIGACNPDETSSGGGGGGSVICTELHRQGIMSDEIYAADQAYGAIKASKDPLMMAGYHAWAKPVVRAMQKSQVVTKAVSLFAIPWAQQMAFEMGVTEKGSRFGKMIMIVGEPFCRIIGKLSSKFDLAVV